MVINSIDVDIKNVQWIMPDVDDSKAYDLLSFDCTLKNEKDYEEVKWYILNTKKPKSNFYTLGSKAALIFDHSVYESDLLTFFEIAGQVLPITIGNEKFYILNVLECVNCLNTELSIWHKYPDGSSGRLINFKFHYSRLSESSIFKIPETSKGDILTYKDVKSEADEFIYAYNSYGFTGLIFNKLDEFNQEE